MQRNEKEGNQNGSLYIISFIKVSFLLFLLLSSILMTACSEDLIIKRVCSRPEVYCEDQAKITNHTVYENLTTVLDTRSIDNQTYYEEIK